MKRSFAALLTLLSLPASVSGLATGAVILISSCSSPGVAETDPAVLYKDAEDDIKSDRYQVALEKLKTVKNKFPYSKYAVDAQLRIADVYFMQELYPEAASNYETFRDLHPKHERVGYAMFRIAKSYFNDMPTNVARDLTPSQKALDAYNDFLRRFPDAPESSEAKQDLAKCRALLAEKELYIANFYMKHNFYESAKPRYQKVIDLYPDTPSAAEAEKKVAIANDRIIKEGPQKGEITYK